MLNYFLQDMAWNATSVSLSKTGMTVIRSKQRLLVFLVQTAVRKPLWQENKVKYPSQPTLKAAVFHLHAMLMSLSFASLLIPKSLSPSATLTAALAICAMEPKYQWSASSCFWHAFLQLSFVKHPKLLTFKRTKTCNSVENSVSLPIMCNFSHVNFLQARSILQCNHEWYFFNKSA